MPNNENLKRQLIRHEGLKLKPYMCPAGKLTIGVGRNLDDNGISEAEAMAMLDADIRGARFDVDFVLDAYKIEAWKLSEARQDVLANMAFNIGRRSLYGFRNMFAAIRAGDFEKAASEMLNSRYARQVGGRASELANQLCSGAYSAKA